MEDYEKYMFDNFDKMTINDKWYPFEGEKHDSEKLMSIVKLRIELYGDFIISNNYKTFKKVIPDKEIIKEMSRDITYSIQFKNHLVQLDYSHLPDPVFKNITKKEREQYQARRTDQ